MSRLLALATSFGKRGAQDDDDSLIRLGTLTSWQILAEQMGDGSTGDNFGDYELQQTAPPIVQYPAATSYAGQNLAVSTGIQLGLRPALVSPSFSTPLPKLSGICGLDEEPTNFVTPKQLHQLYKEYRMLNEIGSGAFGRVCKARRLKDGKEVVVKEIKTVHLPGKMKAATMEEVKVLARMNHPNIVRYHDCFMDESYIDIVMEYCSAGDIGKLVKSRTVAKKPLAEQEIMFLFVQICLALQYTHAAGVLHRDLKSCNCMLLQPSAALGHNNSSMSDYASGIGSPLVKLGDFGVAKTTAGDAGSMCNTVVGTPQYLPPEMLESKPYGRRSDVWALGCILYELCTLKRAFESDKIPVIYYKISQGSYDPLPESCSQSLKDLVQQMLSKDPMNRPTVLEILQIPYVRTHLTLYLEWAKSVPEARPEVLLKSLGETWNKGVSNHTSLMPVATTSEALAKLPAHVVQQSGPSHSRHQAASSHAESRFARQGRASSLATTLQPAPANQIAVSVADPAVEQRPVAAAAVSKNTTGSSTCNPQTAAQPCSTPASIASSSLFASTGTAASAAKTAAAPGKDRNGSDPALAGMISSTRTAVPAVHSQLAAAAQKTAVQLDSEPLSITVSQKDNRRSSLQIDARILSEKSKCIGPFDNAWNGVQSSLAGAGIIGNVIAHCGSSTPLSTEPLDGNIDSAMADVQHCSVGGAISPSGSLRPRQKCTSPQQQQQQQPTLETEQQVILQKTRVDKKSTSLAVRSDRNSSLSCPPSNSSAVAEILEEHSGKHRSKATSGWAVCRSRLGDLVGRLRGTHEHSSTHSLEEWLPQALLESGLNPAAPLGRQQQQQVEIAPGEKFASPSYSVCSASNSSEVSAEDAAAAITGLAAADDSIRTPKVRSAPSQPTPQQGDLAVHTAVAPLLPHLHQASRSPRQQQWEPSTKQHQQVSQQLQSGEKFGATLAAENLLMCSSERASSKVSRAMEQQQHTSTGAKHTGSVAAAMQVDAFALPTPKTSAALSAHGPTTAFSSSVPTQAAGMHSSPPLSAPLSGVGRWIASHAALTAAQITHLPPARCSSGGNLQRLASANSISSTPRGFAHSKSRLGASMKEALHEESDNLLRLLSSATRSDASSSMSNLASSLEAAWQDSTSNSQDGLDAVAKADTVAAARQDSTTNSQDGLDAVSKADAAVKHGKDAVLLEQQEMLRKFRAFKAKLLISVSSAPEASAAFHSNRVSNSGSVCLPESPRSPSAGMARGSSLFHTRWGPQCI